VVVNKIGQIHFYSPPFNNVSTDTTLKSASQNLSPFPGKVQLKGN